MVLGATSLIGQALLDLARRPALTCISRTPPSLSGTVREDRWIQTDLTQHDLPPEIAASQYALGLAPIWVVAPTIPDLARRGIRRIVAFSSTSRWTKASSPEPEERAVARRIAEAEDAFVAACNRHAVAWTLLRPTLIYREGRDGNVSRLATLIRRFHVVPLAGRGEGLRQPVHADDLAAVAMAALMIPEAEGRAYDLPGGETLSYHAMVVRIFESLGRPPQVICLPPRLWKMAFALARPLLPGATAAMGVRMEADLTFDGSDAVRDLSWRPRPFYPRFPDAG